ncbi:unnamed protein product [Leptidea sinapis]|uniref:Uncharacterized protein n=1 Tax=Leptidea sinapis TaxID=189913 RepID=A0A5E4QCA2_9NEOP|nr:unnamed protein product [Leptidea sinapis]
MDVTSGNDSLTIKVLYSPLHSDHGAAARSLARVYMALIRYYTGSWDSTIQPTYVIGFLCKRLFLYSHDIYPI